MWISGSARGDVHDHTGPLDADRDADRARGHLGREHRRAAQRERELGRVKVRIAAFLNDDERLAVG